MRGCEPDASRLMPREPECSRNNYPGFPTARSPDDTTGIQKEKGLHGKKNLPLRAFS